MDNVREICVCLWEGNSRQMCPGCGETGDGGPDFLILTNEWYLDIYYVHDFLDL